jgi:SNF2 family DNA or RNA helicase
MTSFGKFTLHPHQVAAVEWMKARELEGSVDFRGGFLCDEMGLGKTISTIGLLCKSLKRSCLVLCPLAVVSQWVEALLDAKGGAVFQIEKGAWKYMGGNVLKGRIFVTNYDKLTGKKYAELFERDFDRIICDEAHLLRNSDGKKYLALKKIACGFYWFLTGTPIVNSSKDFVSLLRLAGGSSSSSGEAATRYILRRTLKQVEGAAIKEIKADVHTHRLPFLTEEEALFYRAIQGRLTQEFQQLMDQEHANMNEMLTLLLRLRQISVHPQVYIASKKRTLPGYARANWNKGATKVEKIVDILKEDKGSHGYVIFCNFKDEMEILKDRLSKEDCVKSLSIYNGSMSAEKRVASIGETKAAMSAMTTEPGQEFVDTMLKRYASRLPVLPLDVCGLIQDFVGPRHVVILAQIHCAGTGLNLQHMDRVVFTSPWWTAALMDQAAGRVLRLGQTKKVAIHHVYLEEEMNMSLNIDDYMNERVSAKRELCRELLEMASGV